VVDVKPVPGSARGLSGLASQAFQRWSTSLGNGNSDHNDSNNSLPLFVPLLPDSATQPSCPRTLKVFGNKANTLDSRTFEEPFVFVSDKKGRQGVGTSCGWRAMGGHRSAASECFDSARGRGSAADSA
jgi:hypothetical protein